ncbi:MAG TPA: hypothetical protein P5120_18035, partial [Spirochaetota bacterium]|nr:hypothetical protein [Spirochaetota bacterium]
MKYSKRFTESVNFFFKVPQYYSKKAYEKWAHSHGGLQTGCFCIGADRRSKKAPIDVTIVTEGAARWGQTCILTPQYTGTFRN